MTLYRITPTADAAWDRYMEIAQRGFDDRSLLLDRDYVEQTIRAHRQFCDAFNREEGHS